jgi:hypothetical protein
VGGSSSSSSSSSGGGGQADSVARTLCVSCCVSVVVSLRCQHAVCARTPAWCVRLASSPLLTHPPQPTDINTSIATTVSMCTEGSPLTCWGCCLPPPQSPTKPDTPTICVVPHVRGSHLLGVLPPGEQVAGLWAEGLEHIVIKGVTRMRYVNVCAWHGTARDATAGQSTAQRAQVDRQACVACG